ncbi:MAG: ABC transporter ATP-binding protein [Spirochaetaceae bacterium]|nr:ABC transporter ATP-binding protein [Spirochaetaceae bacterium]
MILAANNIYHSFKDKEVLKGINISFSGGIAVLLGENGAGKTLFLKILSGILAGIQGEVTLDGQNVAVFNECRKAIGFAAEELYFWPAYTVLNALTLTADKIFAEQLIQLCRLSEVKQKKIKNLSFGYRKRLNLALALAGRPAFLLLDEPTNGLDPIERDFFLTTLKEQSKNLTVIMASHRLEEVNELEAAALILHNGLLHKVESSRIKEAYHAIHH